MLVYDKTIFWKNVKAIVSLFAVVALLNLRVYTPVKNKKKKKIIVKS